MKTSYAVVSPRLRAKCVVAIPAIITIPVLRRREGKWTRYRSGRRGSSRGRHVLEDQSHGQKRVYRKVIQRRKRVTQGSTQRLKTAGGSDGEYLRVRV